MSLFLVEVQGDVYKRQKKINSKRQSLTNEQYKNILENSQKDEFLYSYNQEVHEGIVGLIAGKYTHEFQKPSFVMKYDEKNEVYRGSARSCLLYTSYHNNQTFVFHIH